MSRLIERLRPERLVYGVLMLLTVAGLLAAGGASFALSVQNRSSAGFVWRTVLAQPGGFLPVAAQGLVIVAIHLLFFLVVYRLGTAATRAGRWFERPAGSVALTWLASVWLVLDLHNDRFPLSVWSYHLGPLTDAPASLALSVLAAGWLAFRLAMIVRARLAAMTARDWRWPALIAAAPLAAGAWSVLPLARPAASAAPAAQPNLVIIGLDSMRRDLAIDAHGDRLVPRLAAVRRDAWLEANVVTPLAHTFPSWTTILTGEHPQASGARYNLAARGKVDAAASLAWEMKAKGYRTIYATDETRFSNIGENFGFDEVIAPQPGVSDFLLAQFFDQPLVNLAVQVPLAEWLLPALAGNRAFAHAYRPDRFLDRLEQAIGEAGDRPTFIAVHLCLAHWPFFSAERAGMVEGYPSDVYFPAAAQVDRQFGALRERLTALGYLRPDGLEVILADHGESTRHDLIDHPRPTLHGGLKQGPNFPPGHGNSLLVAEQWQTFTLFRGRSAHGPIAPGRSDRLASLEDLAPTLRRLLALDADDADSGAAPLMAIADGVGAGVARRTHVLMETGFTPDGFDAANPDGDKALRIAESSFDVQADGRVEMKGWVYDETLPYKQMGVTDGRSVLTVTGPKPKPLLVAQDLASRRSEIWPVNRVDPQARPALLDLACAEPSMQARLAGWCQTLPAAGQILSSR